MSCLFSLVFVFLLSSLAAAQNTLLKGTLYDLNGAVVAGAEALAVSSDNRRLVAKSTYDGSYLLELAPGKYRLEYHAEGFRRMVWNDYLVVKSTFGSMNFDAVLLVYDGHEPCGPGGHCIEIPIQESKGAVTTERLPSRPKVEVENKAGKKPR